MEELMIVMRTPDFMFGFITGMIATFIIFLLNRMISALMGDNS